MSPGYVTVSKKIQNIEKMKILQLLGTGDKELAHIALRTKKFEYYLGPTSVHWSCNLTVKSWPLFLENSYMQSQQIILYNANFVNALG